MTFPPIPDVRAPGFAEEAARQAELLRGRPEETEALNFIEAAFWDAVAAEAWADLPDYDWGPNGPPSARQR